MKQDTICIWEPNIPGLPEKIRVRICGVATVEQPVFGSTYIVEVLDDSLPSETYPYTHTVALECHLKEEEVEEDPFIKELEESFILPYFY